MTRARLGDSPRWVFRCVLATWVGLPALFLLWFGAFLAYAMTTGDGDKPPVSFRLVVTVLHLAILAVLLRGYLARRPLDEVERGYYRMALYVIGVFGLATSWLVGAVVAAALLVHTFFLDKAVRPLDGPAPITKEYREWLERGGDRRDGEAR